jgi:hypothetical protein
MSLIPLIANLKMSLNFLLTIRAAPLITPPVAIPLIAGSHGPMYFPNSVMCLIPSLLLWCIRRQFYQTEFDDDGSLFLGFMDRLGFQTGQDQPGITPDDTLNYYAFMSGDLLRAQRNTDGTYTLENNAQSGDLTGCWPNTTEAFLRSENEFKTNSPCARLDSDPKRSRKLSTKIC